MLQIAGRWTASGQRLSPVSINRRRLPLTYEPQASKQSVKHCAPRASRTCVKRSWVFAPCFAIQRQLEVSSRRA